MTEPNEVIGDEPQSEPQYEIDQHALQAYIERLRWEQNMVTGVLGGLVAAVVGAVAWALITVATDREFALVAIGIGILVGYAVRITGRGVESRFGVAGAVLALLGCALGKLLAIAVLISSAENVSLSLVLFGIATNPAGVVDLLVATFHPMDLLFYGIALYEGYRISFRQPTQEEFAQFLRPVPAQAAESE